jgi:prepilin-type N-terminal cleavage/methylation domain-containing protein
MIPRCGDSMPTTARGLTLVEVLIASAIIALALLGIVGMFPLALRHLRTGGEVTKATGLALRMIERLRDEPLAMVQRYHNADTRVPATFPVDDPGTTPPFHGGTSLDRWREEIAAAALAPPPDAGWGRIQVAELDRGLLSLTVTVGWPASPTDRSVPLTTYLGQR